MNNFERQEMEENIERYFQQKSGKIIILMAHQNETGHAINIANFKI